MATLSLVAEVAYLHGQEKAYVEKAILISEQSKCNKCLRLCSKQNIKKFPITVPAAASHWQLY